MAGLSRKARRERERRDRKTQTGGQVEIPAFTTCLSEWVAHLQHLPPDAPEWDELEDFSDVVADMDQQHRLLRSLVLAEEIDKISTTLSKTYRTELNYLEIDLPLWPVLENLRPALLPLAREIMGNIQTSLPAYSEVHPRASTLRQEEERAPVRAERAQALSDLYDRWQYLAAWSRDSDLLLGPDDGEDEDGTETDSGIPQEEHNAALEKIQRLEQKWEQARSAVETRAAQRDEYRKKVEYLQAVIAQLEQKGGQPALPASVANSAAAPVADAEQPNVESVAEAITAAELDFPHELAVALNSASREESPFQRPNEVYSALRWLATDYRDTRIAPSGGDPEFERRLKEACSGWFYSPKQSDTAKNMFRGEYETTHNGRTYTLDTHIGRGTKGDPQRMIRIAFDWDSERQQVIVGYIGPHQRTQSS